MQRGRYRWGIRLGMVLVLGLIALLWAVGQRTRTLTIENQAQQPIASLQITLGGETRTFESVAAGAEVRVNCEDRGEVSYSVDGKLVDETRIRALGRLTKSEENIQFLLLPNGQLERKPQRKGPF